MFFKLPLNHTKEDIQEQYKRLASKHHPDKGGGTAEFAKLQKEYRALLRALPCVVCEGKGFVYQKNGYAEHRVDCPNCRG